MIHSNQKHVRKDVEDSNAAIVPTFPPIEYINGDIPSELVKPTLIRSKLAEWLPLALKSSVLELIFSTGEHGRSLEQFYSHCEKSKQTILLLEVLQTGATIGMYASDPWHVDGQVYGDGTCFLFRAMPDPVCFKWKGGGGSGPSATNADVELAIEELALVENFMTGKSSYISMGINREGGSGLRLNEDLTKGMSSYTVSFDNDPLAGENVTEFDVGLVEVYRLL
mmetsp:Transcript_23053/g.30600  ORF Transcript_23053/g.30600 Transcript_23053/m.30600 type:complete len:224 (-) Transcript_23053:275-946(-)